MIDLVLLPALPSAWQTGHVRGVRTWGGLIVDLTWDEGQLTSVQITAERPVRVRVRTSASSAGELPTEVLTMTGGQTHSW